MLPQFAENEAKEFILDQNLCKVYPNLSKAQLCQWLASAPTKTYLRVNTTKTTRSDLIEKVRALVTSCSIEPHELVDDVIVISDEDKQPSYLDTDLDSIVIDPSCGAAVLRGADIFAPGVIGAKISLKKGDAVNVLVDLEQNLLKGSTKFDVDQYHYIGQGIAHLGRSDLFKDNIQSGIAIKMVSTYSICPLISDDLLSPIQSLYLMQNLPSILTVLQLDLNPSDKCLDMCAAPGGKTTHIAQFLVDGSVTAFDKSKAKISQINQLAQRLGVEDKIQAYVQDASKATLELESFDKVLLDAPCSALGQRPMLVQKSKAKDLNSFCKLQKKLFDKAFELLKPGGILVYSTCTVTLQENEFLVNWALDKYGPDLELSPTDPLIGHVTG